MARLRPAVGKTAPRQVGGPPHSSALMKLAIRPRNNPIGVASQSVGQLEEGEAAAPCEQKGRDQTPISPPWKDMPPRHTASMSSWVR